MPRAQVWLIILAGLGLLVWGLLSESGRAPADIGETIKDRTSDIISGQQSGSIARNVTVLGDFSPANLDLSGSTSPILRIEYEPATTDLYVNDVKVESDTTAEVVVDDYRGSFVVDGKKLTLDGTASRVTVNGVRLHTGETSVRVRTSGLSVAAFEAEDIDVRRFSASLTGNLRVQKNVVVTLNDEPLEMDAFLGTIAQRDTLSVEGNARRVLVSGEDYMTVVS